MEADGDEVYRAKLDPCSAGVPNLCPASGQVASFANASMNIPEDAVGRMDMASRADVRGRLSLQTHDAYARFHSSCVETALRSDASDNGNGATAAGGSGSGNETNVSEGSTSTNGTADNGGNNTNGTTQDSGANTLQGVGFVAM